MIFTTAQVREMVNRGMRALTCEQRERVDLGTLDMRNGCRCVLGQIYGGYMRGATLLFDLPFDSPELDAACEAHGFYVCALADEFTNYAALEREWTRRLETEREIAELLEPVGSF
jgi:hypothetical protein